MHVLYAVYLLLPILAEDNFTKETGHLRFAMFLLKHKHINNTYIIFEHIEFLYKTACNYRKAHYKMHYFNIGLEMKKRKKVEHWVIKHIKKSIKREQHKKKEHDKLSSELQYTCTHCFALPPPPFYSLFSGDMSASFSFSKINSLDLNLPKKDQHEH